MKKLKMIMATLSLLAFPVYSNIDIDLMDKYLREGIEKAIQTQLEAKGFEVVDVGGEAAKAAIEKNCDVE